MTRNLISTKTDGMGRRKKNFDKMAAGFAAGVFVRMDKLLRKDETRKDFVREAVEREMQRREQEKTSPQHQK